MNCQDNSRLKVPLPEVCNTTDIGCVPLTSGKPRCAPEPDQLPLAYDPGDGTLWVFQCDTRQWIPLGGSFSLSDLDEVNLDNITNICNILKIPVFYNPGVGTIQGSVSLAEFSEQLLKCVRLERRVAILADGKVEFSVPGINGLDPVYVKYEGLTVSGEGSASNPLVVKAEAPPQESPCSYPEKTQAQVDAATSVRIIACVDNEKARIPYPEGESVCSAPRRTLAQALAAGEKDLIACIDGIVVRIPLNEILDYKGDDTMDGVCGFPMTTLAQLIPASTTIPVCANGQTYQVVPHESVFKGLNIPAVPITTGVPSGPPADGTVPFRIDGSGDLYVWDGSSWVKVSGGGGGGDTPDLTNYLTKSEAGTTYETKVHADETYAKKTDIPDIPDPQDLSAYLKKTDASKTYLTKKEYADSLTGTFSNLSMTGRYLGGQSPDRTIQLNITHVTRLGNNNGIVTYGLHNSTFVKGNGTKVLPDGKQYSDPNTFKSLVENELGTEAVIVAVPWVNGVFNTQNNPVYYHTVLALVTDDETKNDIDLLSKNSAGENIAGPLETHAVASSGGNYLAPAFAYQPSSTSPGTPRTGVTVTAPYGFSTDVNAGASKTIYLRVYVTLYWPNISGLLVDGASETPGDLVQLATPVNFTRTLAGGASVNIYAK